MFLVRPLLPLSSPFLCKLADFQGQTLALFTWGCSLAIQANSATCGVDQKYWGINAPVEVVFKKWKVVGKHSGTLALIQNISGANLHVLPVFTSWIEG